MCVVLNRERIICILKRLFPTSRRLFVQHSLRALRLPYYKKVLIVGAGDDPYHDIFNDAEIYVALDIVPRIGVTNVVGDALSMPLADVVFDCILASEVMEHLSDPIFFVRELKRVLKPGGKIILTVPFMFHQHSDPYDYWRPTYQSLKAMFSSFAKVDVYSQGNRMHVIWDLFTTAFSPIPIFFPFRIINHLLVRLPGSNESKDNRRTAPSGFFLIATK